MGKRMHGDSLFNAMEFNDEQVTSIGMMARESDTMFLHVIVDVEQDVPVGMLLATLSPSFFGKDLVANDLLLLIEDEHRGHCGSALKEITSRYKNWAFHKGAKRVYLATSTGLMAEKTKEAYEACGFRQVGTIHEA
jgi:hypothetical protein